MGIARLPRGSAGAAASASGPGLVGISPPLGTSILGTRWPCAAMRRPETPLPPSSDACSAGLWAPRAGSLPAARDGRDGARSPGCPASGVAITGLCSPAAPRVTRS